MLPLIYYYDLSDILFFIKSIKFPSSHFNINKFVHFCEQSTRSSTSNKIKHVYSSTNKHKNNYFNRLPRIYNALPAIDLDLPMNTIKFALKSISGTILLVTSTTITCVLTISSAPATTVQSFLSKQTSHH